MIMPLTIQPAVHRHCDEGSNPCVYWRLLPASFLEVAMKVHGPLSCNRCDAIKNRPDKEKLCLITCDLSGTVSYFCRVIAFSGGMETCLQMKPFNFQYTIHHPHTFVCESGIAVRDSRIAVRSMRITVPDLRITVRNPCTVIRGSRTTVRKLHVPPADMERRVFCTLLPARKGKTELFILKREDDATIGLHTA
jgi:hypothetical protein